MTWTASGPALILSTALLVVGGMGMVVRSVTFVRVTLPHHYGSNPGFGTYEVTVAPWWAMVCVGLWLRTGSTATAMVVFFVGFFALGFVAQLLARLFG